jgi:hypothetical protein
MFAMVAAAPFDNYWHELYGIDVTLWAPAHVMGMLGSYLGGMGIIYAFASELNRMRAAGTRLWLGLGWPGFGMILGFFGLLALALINIISAGYAERLWGLGFVTLANWPLIMAAAIPICLVAALVATGRVGTATLLGLLVTGWHLTFGYSVVGAVDLLVQAQGLQYRQFDGISTPYVAWMAPLLVPLVGLLIDGAWLLTRGQSGLRAWALPLTALAGVVGLVLIERPWMRVLDETFTPPDYWAILWVTLPVVIALALVSGWAGVWWGRVIRSVQG